MTSVIGPAPYIYVSTRLRVRRAKLIPREEYIRILNMSLPEITRLIQESEYKREIDELQHAFSGINLLEVALSWNLAKNYQLVRAITPGHLHELSTDCSPATFSTWHSSARRTFINVCRSKSMARLRFH